MLNNIYFAVNAMKIYPHMRRLDESEKKISHKRGGVSEVVERGNSLLPFHRGGIVIKK